MLQLDTKWLLLDYDIALYLAIHVDGRLPKKKNYYDIS
jgi:hypothetical protein